MRFALILKLLILLARSSLGTIPPAAPMSVALGRLWSGDAEGFFLGCPHPGRSVLLRGREDDVVRPEARACLRRGLTGVRHPTTAERAARRHFPRVVQVCDCRFLTLSGIWVSLSLSLSLGPRSATVRPIPSTPRALLPYRTLHSPWGIHRRIFKISKGRWGFRG